VTSPLKTPHLLPSSSFRAPVSPTETRSFLRGTNLAESKIVELFLRSASAEIRNGLSFSAEIIGGEQNYQASPFEATFAVVFRNPRHAFDKSKIRYV
jgi:hypothetical protein